MPACVSAKIYTTLARIKLCTSTSCYIANTDIAQTNLSACFIEYCKSTSLQENRKSRCSGRNQLADEVQPTDNSCRFALLVQEKVFDHKRACRKITECYHFLNCINTRITGIGKITVRSDHTTIHICIQKRKTRFHNSDVTVCS